MKDILISSEYKIIKFLALNGPSNRWEISERADIEYSTVHSAVKRLLEKLFIAVFDVDKARTGLDKPSYFATYVGKLAVMATLENDDDDDLDLIATSEPSGCARFLILDEWEYICKSNLARNYVLSIIRTRFLDLLRKWDFKTWDIQDYPGALSIFRAVLLEIILWDGYRAHMEKSEILKFFMGNPKLRERIDDIILRVEDDARIVIEDIREVRREYGLEMTSELL